MKDGNPVGLNEKRSADKPPRKPYTKPAFRFERVFETQALSCGKVNPLQATCHASRKTS